MFVGWCGVGVWGFLCPRRLLRNVHPVINRAFQTWSVWRTTTERTSKRVGTTRRRVDECLHDSCDKTNRVCSLENAHPLLDCHITRCQVSLEGINIGLAGSEDVVLAADAKY